MFSMAKPTSKAHCPWFHLFLLDAADVNRVLDYFHQCQIQEHTFQFRTQDSAYPVCVRLRGKGSANFEVDGLEEAPVPLQLSVNMRHHGQDSCACLVNVYRMVTGVLKEEMVQHRLGECSKRFLEALQSQSLNMTDWLE